MTLNYTVSLASDEVIAMTGQVVDSTLSITVPAGAYAFSYLGCVSHSTANGGALSIRTSTTATVSRTGYAQMNGVNALAMLNDTSTTAAGNTADIVWDLAVAGKQIEQARGTIVCAAPCVLTVAVYCATTQSITLHAGTSFSLFKTV